jgi:hypothetical protein
VKLNGVQLLVVDTTLLVVVEDYNGYRLNVPEINMSIVSTQTYYSWNTRGYAKELVNLIEKYQK